MFLIFDLLFNYEFAGSNGYQWCVPPPIMEILRMKLRVDTEIFASPINHYFNKYFSLFYIDKYFGS